MVSGISEKKTLQKKSIEFFDCCINCGRRLDTIPKRNHFFHKVIEIFNLKFCCYYFKLSKGKTLDEFPDDLIDKIRKRVNAFKENESSS